jgi:hypothetical protein
MELKPEVPYGHTYAWARETSLQLSRIGVALSPESRLSTMICRAVLLVQPLTPSLIIRSLFATREEQVDPGLSELPHSDGSKPIYIYVFSTNSTRERYFQTTSGKYYFNRRFFKQTPVKITFYRWVS